MDSRTILHGIVHGKTIELVNDPGLNEGQHVEVTLCPADAVERCGDGLRRSAGALSKSWCADDDDILDRIQQDRQWSTGRALPS